MLEPLENALPHAVEAARGAIAVCHARPRQFAWSYFDNMSNFTHVCRRAAALFPGGREVLSSRGPRTSPVSRRPRASTANEGSGKEFSVTRKYSVPAAPGSQAGLSPAQQRRPVAGARAVCEAEECSALPAASGRLAGRAPRWPEPSARCAAERSALPRSSVPPTAGTSRRRANIPRPSFGGGRSTTSPGCCRRSAISPSGSISFSFSCTR